MGDFLKKIFFSLEKVGTLFISDKLEGGGAQNRKKISLHKQLFKRNKKVWKIKKI